MLVEQLGLDPRYRELVTLWCRVLEDDGILQALDDGWTAVRSPESIDTGSLLRELMAKSPSSHANFLLLALIGERLAQILKGDDPSSLLSANGIAGALEHFYESGTELRGYNRLLQEALRQLVDQLPPEGRLHILEIGADTGGTTSYLLPVLPAEKTMYLFTAASEAALQRAQQKYHEYPFVSYQLWDSEHNPFPQDYPIQHFDVIIASHLFHPARDERETLKQIRQLLAPAGLLWSIQPAQVLDRWRLLIPDLLKHSWTSTENVLSLSQKPLAEPQWSSLCNEVGLTPYAVLTYQRETNQPNYALFLAQNSATEQMVSASEQKSLLCEGTWLIFAGETGVAEQIQARLADHTDALVLVRKGERYQQISTHNFVLRPGSTEDLRALFEAMFVEDLIGERIVYLWGLNGMQGPITPLSLETTVERSCFGLVALVQTLLAAELLTHLWIVTRGVQSLATEEKLLSIEQSPLYGLGRVLQNEHPELGCTLIDLSAADEQAKMQPPRVEEIRALVAEICGQASESEVLLRGTARLVNHIVRVSQEQHVQARDMAHLPEISFALDVTVPGALTNLTLHTRSRIKPPRGAVEIAVAATGLNFKDIALAMGMLPAETSLRQFDEHEYALGLECSGTIVSIGEGVKDFQVGDEVIARGYRCFSSFVLADERLVMHKPAHLSFEETATLLIACMTAQYALHHLAHLRTGERVLIHGAAGGVGLAAIQIVQQAGSEVFATAGSPEKRAYLRALGIEHVFDSRSLTFADEIMQVTKGDGVHIVLNSLSGDAVPKSMSVLHNFGRFLEIGKRDFFEQKKLGLYPFHRALSYFAIDLDLIAQEKPDLIRQLKQEVADGLRQGTYRPLPYRPFQLAQVIDAFRYMQQSQHIGKIVVSMQQQYASIHHQPHRSPITFRPDISYLITGGLSGFGLATARWMVEHGARSLVLVSRSGASSAQTVQVIEEMKQAGVQVLISQTDVTQEDAVIRLLQRLPSECPTLRGIIHAAMVMEDRLLREMDRATWKKVITPKMLGAWNMHCHTRGLALDFFVLFSSVSAVIGNIGQGPYAAGNFFLETLAHARRAQGLATLVVNWGVLADVGYAAGQSEILEYLERQGVTALVSEQALHVLGDLLQEPRVQTTVAQLDWNRLDAALGGTPMRTRWLHLLGPRGEKHSTQQESSLATTLLNMTLQEGQQYMLARLQQILGPILGTTVTSEDPQRPLMDLGLDSLTAIELRNSLKQHLGVDIPIMHLLRPKASRTF